MNIKERKALVVFSKTTTLHEKHKNIEGVALSGGARADSA